MKLCFFDDFKLGVVKGDAVVDVSAEVKDIPHNGPGDLMNNLIASWGSYKARLEAASARGAGVPVSSVRIRPPLPAPEDDRLHGRQLHGRRHPQRPGADQRLPQSRRARSSATATRWCCPTCRHRSSRARPRWPSSSARRRPTSRPRTRCSYIFGYTNFIDGSARGLPPPGNVFFQMKSRDTFAPIGP